MVKNTEVIISTVIEGSETNGSNLMEVYIEYEEEQEDNDCFDECFGDEVLDLRRKKGEVSLEQTKKRNFTVGYNHGKLNVYPLIISYL